MKHRKNFKPIIVNNKNYQYILSFGKYIPNYDGPARYSKKDSIIIYSFDDIKYEFLLENIEFPDNFVHSWWRGKNRDRMWGKIEVEFIIKNYL